MLTKSKKKKLFLRAKNYHKKYLARNIGELDESGTRLMVNTFLTEVLGYAPLEEVKTEYMIKGTYADYVIQHKGTRYFLVEVKAVPLNLTEKHLRQAVNYGANEGIEWALLTNGHTFDLYRIVFKKPIEERKVFSIDLANKSHLKGAVESLQYLHRDSVFRRGLEKLWNRCIALDPKNISGMLTAPQVVGFLRRTLKRRFRAKFSDNEIVESLRRVIHEAVQLDEVKKVRAKRKGRVKEKPSQEESPPKLVAS